LKILIIGAAGRLGRYLVDQALAAEFYVTALARTEASISTVHERLTVVQGDIRDTASLTRVMPGQDAVMVVVAPKAGKLRQKSDLLSTGARNLISAMKGMTDTRVLWVTSAGVDPAYVRRKSVLYKGIIKPLFLANIYEDFKLSEEILVNACLRWIIVRPSRLTDGPLTMSYRVQSDGIPPNAVKISRADVAHFMLRAAVGDRYEFLKPLVTY
jgi:putative NADH-flavin reductase